MRQVGELLNKEVILTDECGSVEMALNEVIFRYSPSLKEIQYVGFFDDKILHDFS